MFTPPAELWKGLTDIPLALLSLLFGMLLCTKNNKPWGILFFIIAVAAFIGAGVHGLALSRSAFCAVWVVLYALLYEAIRRFPHLMENYLNKRCDKEKSFFYWLEAILYIITIVWQYTIGNTAILVLVVFMLVALTRISLCLWKHRPIPKRIRIFLVLLALPIALQTFENFIPYAVVYEHLILAAALFMAYRTALDA